jgi:hypothetical protein
LFHVSGADGGSRVVSRFRCASSDDLPTRLAIGPTLLEPLGFAMDRRMLLGIRDRAEGRPRLRGGLTALVLVALGYAACILLLAVGGAKPGPAPWLSLSRDTYFWWEALFIAPVIVGSGILAAGVLQLGARALGGRGSFEDTLGLLGWAIAASTLATLLPDLGIGIALCAGLVRSDTWMDAITRPTPVLALVWVYLLTYVALFLTTFPAVSRAAHGLTGLRAIGVGWAAFAAYQVLVYVFVR